MKCSPYRFYFVAGINKTMLVDTKLVVILVTTLNGKTGFLFVTIVPCKNFSLQLIMVSDKPGSPIWQKLCLANCKGTL